MELSRDMLTEGLGTQCKVAFCWRCSTTYTNIGIHGHAQGCVYAVPGAIDPHAMNAPIPPAMPVPVPPAAPAAAPAAAPGNGAGVFHRMFAAFGGNGRQ